MKCSKCGAELQDGVLFCRECGTKIEKVKRFCRDCGAEIAEGVKFCSNCGADLFAVDNANEEDSKVHEEIPYKANENIAQKPVPTVKNQSKVDSFGDKIKAKLVDFWNNLDLFFKVVTVISVVTLIMLLIAWGKHNILAIVFSFIQVIGIVVASLMHKDVIKTGKTWIKYIVLAGCICFAIFNCMSYSEKKHTTGNISDTTNNDVVEPETVSIPLSSSECIDMDYLSVETDFRDAGFWNISYEKVEDLQYNEVDKVGSVVSVNVAGNQDFSKGQEMASDTEIVITYHAFTKCKVNVHINFIPNLIFSKYDVEYDFGGYSDGKLAHGEDTDFEVLVEPGEYILEFVSSESSSVKGEIVLNVESDVNASYKICCYSDKISVEVDFVEKLGVAAEDEIMMPAKASEYKFKNYQEVETSLRELGFSNISTEILYDIYFGITEEGETEKVSIDGNSEFNRGDIFSRDADIVITYHMKEEDNPNKVVEEKETENSQSETEKKDDSYSVSYSTNDSNTVKNGNTGVYSYVNRGTNYDMYYIIDFDEGYVYWFTDGNGDESCDKVKIESGDLNDKVIITYHDGDDVWSYGLHFKYVNQPSTLIMQDNDGFEYKYTTTDLSSALSKKNSKNIHEY